MEKIKKITEEIKNIKINDFRLKDFLKKSLFVPVYLSLFQIAFIVLMSKFSDYLNEYGSEQVPELYAMFMDVHSMMFVGFGFLMTFLKRYGFGAVGYNFIVAAYVLEWALLIRGWLEQGIENADHSFTLGVENLLVADFCAAAVLISFGAVIGKASLSQLIIMATIEVVIQSVNEYIGLKFLKAYDVGESMYVHVFGAYFGLAVAKILNKEEVESHKETSTYNSDLFSMIGTLFLWLYWPSFNSATAKDEGQIRAIVNTYLSITASCITTFIVTIMIGKGKINMIHIQNATLAGGVAVGTIADMPIQPFGAMIIGSLAGIVSTFGFEYLTPLLKKLNLHDTCGVNNLHGMPGILSGITGAVFASIAYPSKFHGSERMYVFYPSRIPEFNSSDYLSNLNKNLNNNQFVLGGLGRTPIIQGGYQIAALVLTFGMAIVSGTITGFIIKLPIFEQIHDEEDMFDDELNFITPDDFKLKLAQIKTVENKNNNTQISL